MDDDDAFLYGEPKAEAPTTVLASVLQPISSEAVKSVFNGVIEHLEAKAEEEEEPPFGLGADESEAGEENVGGEEEEETAEEEEEEDDIEIIMDQPSRSIDNRPSAPPRPALNRSTGGPQSTPVRPPHAQSQLTTEYTPRDRNVPPSKAPLIPSGGTPQTPSAPRESTSAAPEQSSLIEGVDLSTLPPATAPPSHPSINFDIPGVLDGLSILEVDISTMAEKPWRIPGSDISDWFNYGFDEISWEAYCYRRRDLGDLANVLKTNVLNFAAMPEDQLIALPPELRTMVVTGANAMMNTTGQGMMGPSVGMNPMMEMPGMGPMNMVPMGMGMNGDMGMQMQQGGPLMQDGPVPGQVPVGQNGTPEQGVQMGMQDGFGPGMMGMGGDFGMQQERAMGQPMYPTIEGSATPVPVPVHTPVPTPAPAAPAHMGRGAPPA
ncbi:Fip1-domain-containing protein [Rhizopogon salebrosus TDB-379]|nr:Fip1-domain-containing protein [Rhizopogon salebrosus TDB-379]